MERSKSNCGCFNEDCNSMSARALMKKMGREDFKHLD